MKKSIKTIIILTLVLLVLIIVGQIIYVCPTQKSPKSKDNNPELIENSSTEANRSNNIILQDRLELPICLLNKDTNDHQIRSFKYYTICYRESYEQAEWSAYCLTSDQLIKNTDRTNNFRADPMIITGSAQLDDYKHSGYDRGHLTPAADMAFSKEAMSETFFMSNMTPQTPSFNRDIWMHLEKQVREWCSQFGRVYVVSGPILEKAAIDYDTIGSNKVVIPEYFYKTILAPIYKDAEDLITPEDCYAVIGIAFIIPNEACQNDFWDYVVSIDEVENRTGLDFYSLLDDEIEEIAENDVNIIFWK